MDKRKQRLSAAVLVMALASLACGQIMTTVTPTPAATALPTRTPEPPTQTATVPTATAEQNTAVIQATVYVRQLPASNSLEIGSLTTGQTVEIVKCDGDWCQIKKPRGYVWRGCTDNNPDGLLCQARP